MNARISERNQDESLSELVAGSDVGGWHDYERREMCVGSVSTQLDGTPSGEHLYRYQSSTGCHDRSCYRSKPVVGIAHKENFVKSRKPPPQRPQLLDKVCNSATLGLCDLRIAIAKRAPNLSRWGALFLLRCFYFNSPPSPNHQPNIFAH